MPEQIHFDYPRKAKHLLPEEQRERAQKALKLNGDISYDYDSRLLGASSTKLPRQDLCHYGYINAFGNLLVFAH